jgi:phosphoglycerate dehydrogenase-like enzyme
MAFDVVCLRPEKDFLQVGVTPPTVPSITYRAPDDPELKALLADAKAVVIPAVGPKLSPDLFEGSSVKLVQVTGAGVDRLDGAAMKRLGIAVANVAGGSNTALAEYTVSLALVLMRRFAWADAEIKKGNYVDYRKQMISENLTGLEDMTIGVVGLGSIGLAVATAFHRMGSSIVYYDPALKNATDADQISALSLPLEDVLKLSDVVTLHVPLIPETEGLIGDPELSTMKPGATLIHASRGGVVDEMALAQHLISGHIGGAAVDVYSSEPPEADNPLFSLKGDAAQRIIFTPHIAGVTRQAWAKLFQIAWDNVERVLTGNDPINRV